MVIKMADVKSAVVKASNKSHREGSWANRPEIKEKIVGKLPTDLDGELVKLVRAGSIEKKSGAMLWRPTNGAGAGGSPSAKRNRIVDTGDRNDRDKDDKRRDNRLAEDTTKVATSGALAAGSVGASSGAVSSSITRMLM